MSAELFQHLDFSLGLFFPAEWVRAALVLALMGSLVVVGLFGYLNHYTKRWYFRLWTVGALFYAAYLAASVGLEETPDAPYLVMARRACISVSALFFFFGSCELAGKKRDGRELAIGVFLLVLWSFVAAYRVQDWWWITVPVFALLGLVAMYTGWLFARNLRKYHGAGILAIGFVLWGAHVAALPFLGSSPQLQALGYLCSSVLSLLISVGMMVLVVEEAHLANVSLKKTAHDTEEQRKALEQQVYSSEEKYRALFDAASDATFLVDLETLQIIEANVSATRLVSVNSENLTGRNFLDFVPSLNERQGGGLLTARKMFEEIFKASAELKVLRSDSSALMCEGEARLVHAHGRPAMQVSLHEVSERKNLEKQLRESEKLSALGQLVAGVAHELNNPLAVIMGYTQLLTKRPDIDARFKGEVQKIHHESERAAKIVRNLLTFARPRDPEMRPVDVNQVVSNVIESRAGELQTAKVQLDKRLAAQLPRTKADPHQLEQVISNLINNAIQAQQKQSKPARIEVSTKEFGAYIRITVSDNGPGIPANLLNKIFEPFFTTKSTGQGTGLGLAIAHAIMQEHHGKIWAQSEEGNGARFFVELPIVPCSDPEPVVEETPVAAVKTTEPQLQPETEVAGASHRLLIVDDEPGIVEVLKETLTAPRCTVDTAGNGSIALELIKQNKYDLVICDLRMPDLDGERFYHIIRKSHPQLAKRIVFITGDTVSSNSRSFLEWTGNRWFSKPFNVAEIDAVVANFLRDTTAAVAAATR